MEGLAYNVKILKYHGLYDDGEKKFLVAKKMMFILVMILTIVFVVGAFCDLLITRDSKEDFTEALLMCLAGSSTLTKLLNTFYQKNLMHSIIDDLGQTICQPKSLEEKKIHDFTAKIVRVIFLGIFYFTYILVVALMFLPFTTGEFNEKLPYPMFSYFIPMYKKAYIILYFLEWIVMVGIIPAFVAVETLLFGMLILIANQFDLLSHRLTNIAESKDCEKEMNECINHHTVILEIVSKAEKFLMGVITYFLAICTSNLCSTIFQLSMAEVGSVEFFMQLSILIFIFNQLFLYCWFGNMLMVKSQQVGDSAYFGHWITLDIRERKKLIMTLMIAKKGSRLSFYRLITLTLPTFILVVRASYTSYNVLRHSGSGKEGLSHML